MSSTSTSSSPAGPSSASSARRAPARPRPSGSSRAPSTPTRARSAHWARTPPTSGAGPASGSGTCPSSSRCTRTSPRTRTSTSSRACSGCSGDGAGGAFARCSSWWACGTRGAAARASSRAACSAASSSRAHSSTSRTCCCSTSPPRASTRSCARSVWEELTRLRDAGRTLLVTTQYVTEAEQCDAVALIAGGRLVALGTPMDLRRRASGGELVEIETAAAFDPERSQASTASVRCGSTGSRTFVVVTDDAGTTTPLLDDLVAGAGGRLVAAREIHPTFDEVFTMLVERDRGPATRWSPEPPATTTRPLGSGRPRPRPPGRRRGGRGMSALARASVSGEEPDPAARLHRPRARRGPPPAGRAGVARVRPVPRDGGLRPRLQRRPQAADTILVIPPQSGLHRRRLVSAGRGPASRSSTSSPTGAGDPAPAQGDIEVVAIAPGDASSASRRAAVGDRGPDRHRGPGAGRIRGPHGRQFANAVNREIIRRAAEEGKRTRSSRGSPRPRRSPRGHRAAHQGQPRQHRPDDPDVVGYFGPAVLALILQHMAVTLTALSLVRERTCGVMELFRVSPVSPGRSSRPSTSAFGLLSAAIAGRGPRADRRGARRADARHAGAARGRGCAAASVASLGSALLISVVSDRSARPSSCRCSCSSLRCSSRVRVSMDRVQ